MFKSAVLIILCIFVMDLYCFEWLKQESTNNRKTKIRENSKSSVFFSWIRKWFHSWDRIRMFWYFHSCIELVKKSKHPFYEWNYTTHWISSIYAWTIKKPYSHFSSGSCIEHAQVNLYVIEFWVLPILYKILFIHAIYPSKKFWICKSKPFYGTSMVARRH